MRWRNWFLAAAGAAILASCADYPYERAGYYDRYGYYHGYGEPRYYGDNGYYARRYYPDRDEEHYGWWRRDD